MQFSKLAEIIMNMNMTGNNLFNYFHQHFLVKVNENILYFNRIIVNVA